MPGKNGRDEMWALVSALVLVMPVWVLGAESAWTTLAVPGVWEEVSQGRFRAHDGYAWYRCAVRVPASWEGKALHLRVEQVDNVHEAYVNGIKVGGAGSMPPAYRSGLGPARQYAVPAEQVRAGAGNVVAIRVYDREGRGGFKGTAPALVAGD